MALKNKFSLLCLVFAEGDYFLKKEEFLGGVLLNLHLVSLSPPLPSVNTRGQILNCVGALLELNNTFFFSFLKNRSVTDPRDGKRVALKKMPNVFQSLVSSKRVFRELKMLCFFKHDNVIKHYPC